ncbi:MAG: hypothetical protein HC800_25535 [Phormidesmis sp. RL_2_1]|nr:hypothetical protein [Phormidesmis sp. RL_2_1]
MTTSQHYQQELEAQTKFMELQFKPLGDAIASFENALSDFETLVNFKDVPNAVRDDAEELVQRARMLLESAIKN